MTRQLGAAVKGWTPPHWPGREPMTGRWCRIEPLSAARNAAPLHAAFAEDDGTMWDYMPVGPFADEGAFRGFLENAERSEDPLFHTILDERGDPAGFATYLRIEPSHGVIEIGFITLSPRLRRSRAATEAMYLMMKRAFDLDYRRYEWKCNALNEPSRRAASRLGFTHEGRFRQHMIVKGRNRDTDWFSVLDAEWPRLRAGFEAWLDPANFDAAGNQKRRLEECRA
ncbi:MAG: GNAT family N-acetyltransferase [Rubricella sp.]